MVHRTFQLEMNVHFFQRRRRPNANYSLEFIFDDVRARLRDDIIAEPVIAPCYSNGLARRALITLHAALKQGDVNHVTGDITFVTLALDRRRTLLTVLDCGNVLSTTGLKRFLLKTFWLDLPVARSELVTTISEQARVEILRLTGCPPEKVVVVPVAISERFTFSPKPDLASPPRVLAMGTSPNKNLLRLVEALDGLGVHLTMVGQMRDDVREALSRSRVQFESLQNLSAEAVVELYRSCDLVAFPSTYEGFGMPILEGQATGRPVLTSSLSSMPEVAGDGACLVDPFDVASIRTGLLRLLGDADYRGELVTRGLENVKRFDPQRIANAYLSLYREVERRRA